VPDRNPLPLAQATRGDPPADGLRLYLRDDCGLCDQALAVLAAARAPLPWWVVIDGDPVLEARYGQRIPVLALGDRELDWPFDSDTLRAWLP
jgi:hypothetical protein